MPVLKGAFFGALTLAAIIGLASLAMGGGVFGAAVSGFAGVYVFGQFAVVLLVARSVVERADWGAGGYIGLASGGCFLVWLAPQLAIRIVYASPTSKTDIGMLAGMGLLILIAGGVAGHVAAREDGYI